MRRLNIRMDGQIAVLAVAEKGSFKAAGDYLGVGKSAIRKQVAHIDNELGAHVFRFAGGRMVPTVAGDIYLPEARESVRHARLGVDRVHAFIKVQANDLRIGYSTYLNSKLLEVVRRIRPEGNDAMSITRESLLTHQVVTGVLEGEFHVGFGILPILEPDISSRLLFEEPLVACLPVGHRLATKPTIHPEDLENEPIVSLSKRGLPGRHQEIVTHFESLGAPLNFVADAYSVDEALWLVTQGVGVSLMSRFSATSYRHEVVIRPLSDRLLTVKSGVFTRRDHDQKLVKDFVDLAWNETTALRPLQHGSGRRLPT
jgi:DNA-binding transcriptional LysR family regulator